MCIICMGCDVYVVCVCSLCCCVGVEVFFILLVFFSCLLHNCNVVLFCLLLLFILVLCIFLLFFFFFKQKTAYEMRFSDWISDVCSSDLDTERGDEGLGGRKALALGQDRPGLGRVAVDLIGVEQAERPGEEPPSLAAIFVILLVVAPADLLPEDAEAGLLALADLGAAVLPLTISAPDPARIAAAIGRRPERHRVDAAIGLAAGDVGRPGDIGARSEEHTSELQSLMGIS